MATGVSIEVDHFQKVYGLFYGTATDADASQALIRVRPPVPRVVWCAKQGKNFSKVDKSEYAWKLKHALKTKWSEEISVIRSNPSPDLVPGVETFNWDDNPHVNLWSQIAAKTNAAMWNLRTNLLERLRYEGHPVEVVQLNSDCQVREVMKQARAQVKQDYHQAVSCACILTKPELAAVERKEGLGVEDQLNLIKTQIADFYQAQAVTPELVAFDNAGQRRNQIVEMEALLYGSELSLRHDQDALERQAKYGQGLFPP